MAASFLACHATIYVCGTLLSVNCQSDEHWNCFKGSVRNTFERQDEVYVYGLF